MSRITVTDIVPGDSATSASVNTTITSFNTGTAAGALNNINVRVEGIDRRTMSGSAHVVFSNEVGSNNIASDSGTGVSNATANYVILGTLTTIDVAPLSTTQILLHAMVNVTSASQASGAARRTAEFIIQRSLNAGVTWADVTGTYRKFNMRETGNTGTAATAVPGIDGYAGWTLPVTASGATTRWRIGYKTTNGVINFYGTILLEMFGQ